MSIYKIIWFFENAGPIEVVGPLLLPLGIGFFLYQSQYLWVICKVLAQLVRAEPFPKLAEEDRSPVLATVPSLLRKREELEGIQAAIMSLLSNRYPGSVHVVACVDGSTVKPKLFRELQKWAEKLETPEGAYVYVSANRKRMGKGVAIDTGVQMIAGLVESGEIPPEAAPVVFFNVDADSELSHGALELMVHTLRKRSRITGKRGTVVTSHVAVPKKYYWSGARNLFTSKGIISLSVAREYIVSLGLGRHNGRFIPHVGASGALYCTWYDVIHAAPYYARFIETLRFKDWLKWWVGYAPPNFDEVRHELEPLPEGIAGMGDDTWITFLALSCRWRNEKLSFAYPRTPFHAFFSMIGTYFLRPYRYDRRAKLYTSTPTTVRGLYRQRVRWNVSRIWTAQRWVPGLMYAWAIGGPVALDVGLKSLFHIFIVIGIVVVPFTNAPVMWFAMVLLVEFGYFLERSLSTGIALLVDRSLRRSWHILLALPTAGFYHFYFNIFTTIDGFTRQVFGLGFNSGFTPEKTLIDGKTTRIAMVYRIRRFLSLAWRSAVQGDVPLGWFWLGWGATPWTKNGYEGWDAEHTKAKAPPQPPHPVADLPVPQALPAARSGPQPVAAARARVSQLPVARAEQQPERRSA